MLYSCVCKFEKGIQGGDLCSQDHVFLKVQNFINYIAQDLSKTLSLTQPTLLANQSYQA